MEKKNVLGLGKLFYADVSPNHMLIELGNITTVTFPMRVEYTPVIHTPTFLPTIPSMISNDTAIESLTKWTKKDIIDFSLNVARRIGISNLLNSRKQIEFKRSGSGTSTALYRQIQGSKIEYSDFMLKEGNWHYKKHTLIHEVCHILVESKYGRGQHHNHKFVLEEMRIHEKFGYRTYYATKEEGYIVALKELSTDKYVYVKHNYKINDEGFPILKRKEKRFTAEWREDARRKFLASVIRVARKEYNGAKVHTIHISKGGRGWREVYAYYKCDKGEERCSSSNYWASEITRIFKPNVNEEQKRVGLIYEWKRKVLK